MINTTIGLLLALIMFGLNVLVGFYNAGKYAHGGKDVREGITSAISSIVGAIIALIAFALLLLGI